MDLSVNEFVDGLLSEKAHNTPSDDVKPESLTIELPEWFDEKKFNKGRTFFWHNCFFLATSMLVGLVAVFSVPSILRVLIGSRRSSSQFTAYKRYLSTTLHVVSWMQHELKPGTISWRSLYAVRSRHLRAGLASKAKGIGVVSQRDLALTQFGFVGFCILKPDKFGIEQTSAGDWEAYNHLWRTIGYMIGIEDRYNICRKNIEETRAACQLLLERVFTPCLENVPEYFEHMSRVMLEGLWSINPTIDTGAMLYQTRYLADVPGYIYTETDRIKLQNKLMEHLKGQNLDTGVDVSLLTPKPAIEGLPDRGPRYLYYNDYHKLDTVPPYKKLTNNGKWKLAFNAISVVLYHTYLGRLYFNLNYRFSLFLMRYLPYLAFYRFGVLASYVNIFAEDPVDDTKPKLNAEYYEEDNKPQRKTPWYLAWLPW